MPAFPRRPALVVVDVQKAIDDPRWGPRNNPDAEATIAELLTAWRSSGLPVLHVRHDSTEPDSPYRPGQPGNEFKPAVAPLHGEPVVAKRVNSAFIDSDLAERIEQAHADALVFVGVLTHNSVEATVRMSGNLGYRTYVVRDGCWSVDIVDLRGQRWTAEQVHELSLAKMSGKYATVVTAREARASISR